jgi:hypothetical protein
MQVVVGVAEFLLPLVDLEEQAEGVLVVQLQQQHLEQ